MKVIGVSYNKNKNKWSARISFESTQYYLGSFDTQLEAAQCRYIAEKKYHMINKSANSSYKFINIKK